VAARSFSERTVEQRLQRLEDIASIRYLKHTYAILMDAGLCHENEAWPDAPFLALFAPDAVWESNVHGRHEGVAALRDLFTGWAARLTFAKHHTIAPSIDVAPSGVEATGHWYTWETITSGGAPIWLAATYNDDFVKRDDGWRIQHIRSNIQFRAPYHEGWAAEAPLPQMGE